MYEVVMHDEYLEHHGILGMKWGVRRYQNEDGSLTSAGRAHYGVESVKGKVKDISQKIKTKKAEHNTEKSEKKKTEDKKTDIKDETEETKEKKGLSKGQKVALAIAATAVTLAVAKHIHDKGGKDYIEDKFNDSNFANIKANSITRKENRSRERMIKEFDKKYGGNDPELRRNLERAAKSRDTRRLADNGSRTVTTHHDYDADYLAALDKSERQVFKETGYDTTETIARPRRWAASHMTEKDFRDITDSYFNDRAEEYLRDLGLKTR